MFVIGAQRWVPKNRGGGRAIQRASKRGTPATNRGPTAHRSTVVVKGRHSNEGCSFRAIEPAQLGQPVVGIQYEMAFPLQDMEYFRRGLKLLFVAPFPG